MLEKTQRLRIAIEVFAGVMFFSQSMKAGGNLAIGLNREPFSIAMVCGNFFLGVYCSLLCYIGQRTGLTLSLLVQRSFRSKGSCLPPPLISFTQTGWLGAGVAMSAIPAA